MNPVNENNYLITASVCKKSISGAPPIATLSKRKKAKVTSNVQSYDFSTPPRSGSSKSKPSSESTEADINDSRLDIRMFTRLLESTLNLKDFTNLGNLISNYMETACIILSKTNVAVYGRDFFAQHYHTLISKCSYCSFQFVLKERYHSLTIIDEFCVGSFTLATVPYVNELKYIWDSIFGNLNFSSKSVRLSIQQNFYAILLNVQNESITFHLKRDLYLITNDDQSLISRVMWEVVSLDFSHDWTSKVFADIFTF